MFTTCLKTVLLFGPFQEENLQEIKHGSQTKTSWFLYDSEVSGQEEQFFPNMQYGYLNPESQNPLKSKQCHENQLGYQGQSLWLISELEVQLLIRREVTVLKSLSASESAFKQ